MNQQQQQPPHTIAFQLHGKEKQLDMYSGSPIQAVLCVIKGAFNISSDQSFSLMNMNTRRFIVPQVSDHLFDETQDTPKYEIILTNNETGSIILGKQLLSIYETLRKFSTF
jgi:hypothetical protein